MSGSIIYRNSSNVAMPVSGVATGQHLMATGTQQILTGGNGNDALRSAGLDTLVGGSGDDLYYVASQGDIVVEQPGGGTDTVISYAPQFTLPDNVENLTVGVANGVGIGNGLDNLMIAAANNVTLDGDAGNDVLVAGTGQDTFIIPAAISNDVIYGFKHGIDHVRIDNGGLSSFAGAAAAMRQVGADVVLALPSGHSLTFRDTTVGAFQAQDFLLPTALSAATSTGSSMMTFDDEFNSLSASATGQGTMWKADSGTLSSNHEAEDYSNNVGAGGPFSISNGVLDITAQTGSNALNLPYNSGALNTSKSFSQTYGYFEMRAQLPAGQGMWPAFWLMPADGSWPPELDAMEQLGNNTSVYYTSTHSAIGGSNVSTTKSVYVGDTSTGFHTYGVDWEKNAITYYFDGSAVMTLPTPADMDKPMYMIVNLAVGGAGSWPGAATGESGQMLVDYVRAYSSLPASMLSVADTAASSSVSSATTTATAGTAMAAPVTAATVTAATVAAAVSTTASTTVSKTSATVVMATGSHDQYTVAATNGALYLQDNVAGRDGTQTLPNASEIVFTDGTGVFDASGNAEEVARLYKAAFGQLPDLSGLNYWATQANGGSANLPTIAAAFVKSTEFQHLYGTLSNQGYVQQLYQNVLGRAGSAAEVQYWTKQLAGGTSRGNVLLSFADSPENKQNTKAYAGDKDTGEAYRLYQAAFNRTPDTSGLSFWIGSLDAGAKPMQIAVGFTKTAEFTKVYGGTSNTAFVTELYQNVLHRAPDAAGAQYWINALNGGASRAAALLSFSDCAENRIATASATHDNWVFLPKS